MRLNLGAVLHVTHAYVGAMVEQGWGRIVTIVSDAGRRGERFQAIYGAAKAGAMGFVRGLAAEVGAHGVTANCVALGTMKTGVLEDALAHEPGARGQARPAVHDSAARPARRPGPARRAAVQRRRLLDHRPGVPGRRRLRLRPVAARSPARPGRLVGAMIPLWPELAVLALRTWLRAVSPSPRAHGSARKPASRPGPPGGTSCPSSSPTTASTRSRSASPSSACSACSRSSPTSSARSAAASTPAAAGLLGRGKVLVPIASLAAAASTVVQRRSDDDDDEVAKRGLRFGLGLVLVVRRGRRRLPPRPRRRPPPDRSSR